MKFASINMKIYLDYLGFDETVNENPIALVVIDLILSQ